MLDIFTELKILEINKQKSWRIKTRIRDCATAGCSNVCPFNFPSFNNALLIVFLITGNAHKHGCLNLTRLFVWLSFMTFVKSQFIFSLYLFPVSSPSYNPSVQRNASGKKPILRKVPKWNPLQRSSNQKDNTIRRIYSSTSIVIHLFIFIFTVLITLKNRKGLSFCFRYAFLLSWFVLKHKRIRNLLEVLFLKTFSTSILSLITLLQYNAPQQINGYGFYIPKKIRYDTRHQKCFKNRNEHHFIIKFCSTNNCGGWFERKWKCQVGTTNIDLKLILNTEHRLKSFSSLFSYLIFIPNRKNKVDLTFS